MKHGVWLITIGRGLSMIFVILLVCLKFSHAKIV